MTIEKASFFHVVGKIDVRLATYRFEKWSMRFRLASNPDFSYNSPVVLGKPCCLHGLALGVQAVDQEKRSVENIDMRLAFQKRISIEFFGYDFEQRHAPGK